MQLFKHSVFYTLLLAAGTSLVACMKNPASPEAAKAELLVGRWELTQTDGGLSGQMQPVNPAEKHELVFDDSRVTFLRNGVVTGKAKYSLFRANSFVNRRPRTFLAYGARSGTEKEFIERISASELVVVEDYANGLGYYYARR